MFSKDVDPAALMLAALVATLPALTGDGRWGPISVIIFPFVGAILLSYVWPERRRLPPPTRTAFWAAMTLVSANAMAPFWQWLAVDRWNPDWLPGCQPGVLPCSDSAWGDNSLLSTLLALAGSALVVGLITWWRWRPDDDAG